MRTEQIPLPSPAPGATSALTVQRFGEADARPLVYVQAGLHADEAPGMLVAHHLRERLTALEAEGRIVGEIVLVPCANPIGLAQTVLGQPIGRFDLADGANFNRHYPDLGSRVAPQVEHALGADPLRNVRLIRERLAGELDADRAVTPAEHLKLALLRLAIGADWVLDLHCDGEAVMHLYTLTPSADAFAPLAALLGARAVLLATESGDDPFDEACSRPWHELARRFPDRPIPLACHATTVELRGQTDVDHGLAAADAEALVDFMALAGAIAGPAPAVPPARCAPTPLAGSEPLMAPVSGLIAFHRAIGEDVEAGERIADIVDPVSGAITPVHATTTGVFFARTAARYAAAGRRLGKVAGAQALRTGKLLSP